MRPSAFAPRCAVVKPSRTTLTAAALCLALAGMGVLTSYSVTLYRLFCQVTGANGTTQRVTADTAKLSDRWVTVLFDTNTAPGLPWRFVPLQRSVRVRLGQDTLVLFEAQNLSSQPIVGHAAFNVTPEKIGLYFKKIQCFCFSEEKLAPGATVQMPVDFFVDPALGTDPSTQDVHEITLSYTFFRSLAPNKAQDLNRFTQTPGDAAAGAQAFAERCSACHALDSNRTGPALGGVVGRAAAAAPGFSYSQALRQSHLVWTPAALQAWLSGPRTLVPGAAMPVNVADPQLRNDIIAYLKAAAPKT